MRDAGEKGGRLGGAGIIDYLFFLFFHMPINERRRREDEEAMS